MFNIATLNQSFSEIKKRQEIGRGLRLSVNQHGRRVYDPPETPEGDEINLLTIIPNETYETFSRQYQQQIRESFGTEAKAGKLRKNHKGKKPGLKTLRLNRNIFDSEAFQSFWNTLARKSEYSVSIDEKRLIRQAARQLEQLTVPEYQAEIRSNRIEELSAEGIKNEDRGGQLTELKANFAPVDVVNELSTNTGISHKAAYHILNRMSHYSQIIKNPARFVQQASAKIKNLLMEEMLKSLDYRPTGDILDSNRFSDQYISYQETREVPSKGVYDKIIIEDSTEEAFVREAENDPDVLFVLKLPAFFTIPTPLGPYRPAFGVALKENTASSDKGCRFFVIDTKEFFNMEDDKKPTARGMSKMKCARKHFEALEGKTGAGMGCYIAPVKNYHKDFKDKI
ncbi:MAG: hypothetical protein K9J27_11055 [Bacteroidales bacterium]|nr:hypothetical protein [Bacteroidales bacterium]MCF8334401.1 hypothetical protein [Bacteroidales bacterium]